jgi:UDP-GlcNAc:undecaprenyl-phosphate GlcNAc-1-phosphate transferase
MQPTIRLIVQIVASWLVIVTTDVYLEDLGNLLDLGEIQLGSLGIPLTIFMVVGVCNAFNMLDGMDGLVSFLLLIPGTFLALLSSLYGHTGLLYLASIVLSVFIVFNLGLFGKTKKIFLGDSGSMWLGFITAWFLICLSQSESSFNFAPVSALWFVLIPLVDALSTFMTRIWNKKSIFHGDRSHLHHILIDAGLKKWLVLIIFLLFSTAFSALGFFFIVYEIPEYYQFYGFLTVWFFYHLLIKQPMAIRETR